MLSIYLHQTQPMTHALQQLEIIELVEFVVKLEYNQENLKPRYTNGAGESMMAIYIDEE